MELLIALLMASLVIVALFPSGLFKRKNPYSDDGSTSNNIVHQDVNNKMAATLIMNSRKLSKIIKVRVSTQSYEKWQKQICYAGLNDILTVEDYQSIKIYLALITFGFFAFMTILNYSSLNLLLLLITTAMGYYVPDNWIIMRGKNRQWIIQKEMPHILSSMAIITDAGMSLMQALDTVVEQNDGVLCQEFTKVLEDIKIGIDQKDAFIKLSQRTNVDEMSYFVSAITQGIEKGNSGITKIVREQAKESWEKRKHKAKELAEQASMKLFLPLLLLVFPAFMIYLIGPMVFSIFQMFG